MIKVIDTTNDERYKPGFTCVQVGVASRVNDGQYFSDLNEAIEHAKEIMRSGGNPTYPMQSVQIMSEVVVARVINE